MPQKPAGLSGRTYAAGALVMLAFVAALIAIAQVTSAQAEREGRPDPTDVRAARTAASDGQK